MPFVLPTARPSEEEEQRQQTPFFGDVSVMGYDISADARGLPIINQEQGQQQVGREAVGGLWLRRLDGKVDEPGFWGQCKPACRY